MKTAIVSIMMFPAIMLGGATTLRNPPTECSAPPLTVLSQYNNTYGCNAKSELFSSARTGGSPYLATEHEYAYDPIGNRTSSSDLGTTRAYTANSLNHYTEISTLRAPAPPRETFIPQFDDDGNQTLIQTKTGVWSVTYNGENCPIQWSCVASNSSTPNSSTPSLILMSFDRMGRRVSYTETVGVTTNAHRTFVYDNYLQIANSELTTSNSQLFVWDPTEPIATRPLVWQHNGGVYYYSHDGNKNISELVDDDGSVVAHYEYAPFGDVTATVGNLAYANRFRFSSEYSDDTLGLVYYNYRHYEPVTGKWMRRDYYDNTLIPYSFVDNDVANCYDDLGLSKRPARNADRGQRDGHRSRKNGNKGDKHSRAYGYGGRENPRRVRVNRRGKLIKTPIKGNKECVSTSALSVAGAIETGLIVGNVAVWAFEEMGWYDETVDWSYEIKGELCCEYPFMPVVTEIFVKIKDGEAILSDPLWGILTTSVSAEYEVEKQTTITFSCCCENPKRVSIDIQKLSVNVYENWLWGVIGSSRGVARLTTVSIKTPCGR
ncbi:MAG: hypothetical protein IJU44_12450 [Kiritimatiellae bacterium]|nr:hypothetical protein [Kiritimatiellia bacterium]